MASNIFYIVLAIAVALWTFVFIPWYKKKFNTQKKKDIYFTVNTLVRAAEQIFTGTKTGKEKKQWVLDQLAQYEINISEEEINAIIESCVLSLKEAID